MPARRRRLTAASRRKAITVGSCPVWRVHWSSPRVTSSVRCTSFSAIIGQNRRHSQTETRRQGIGHASRPSWVGHAREGGGQTPWRDDGGENSQCSGHGCSRLHGTLLAGSSPCSRRLSSAKERAFASLRLFPPLRISPDANRT